MIILRTVVAMCVVSLIVTPILGRLESFKLFPEDDSSSTNAADLSASTLDNLKRVLDYIYKSPEFLPLTLSIVSWSTQPDIVSLVSRFIAGNTTKGYQVQASNFSVKSTWMNQADLTWIFIMEDPYTLKAFVEWQRNVWKAKNQYVIIYTNRDRSVIWRHIFSFLWETYDVYRIIVTSIQEKFRCLYAYSPFEKIRKDYGVVRKICLPSTVRRDYTFGERRFRGSSKKVGIDFVSVLTNETKLFEKFRDCKDYPVPVTVFESLMMHIERQGNATKFSGLDATVMRHLEQGLRANFQINALGHHSQEDPFQESLRLLENGDTKMIVTTFFTKTYSGYRRYEFTAGVYEDQLCFIAPAAGTVPKSYMPYQPFQRDLWLLLLFCNLLVTTLWFFIKHCVNAFRAQKPILLPLTAAAHLERLETSSERIPPGATKSYDRYAEKYSIKRNNGSVRFSDSSNIDNTFFKSDISTDNSEPRSSHPPNVHPHIVAFFDLLILSCYPLQGANSASQKVLLITTLFFGLIITGLYQSGLVSGLSEPSHYPELDTMEDVANSNLTIVTKYKNLKRDTFAADTPLGKRLMEKVEVLKSNGKTNDLVAYGREVIALGRYSSLKLEDLSVYYDEDGNEMLHIVDECPASYILSYVVSLYSPWLERIDNLLLRMHEAGLIDWWYRGMLGKVEADEQARKAAKSAKRIKLTLEHYSFAFLGLFVGLLCCTAVFLAEVYFARSAFDRV